MEDSEPATGTPIYFSPIYGADDHVALCYVVQVNGITLLLDCGWTDDFDIELLAPLELQADALQAVLLSHSSIQHLGALPYLVSKLKCNAEVLFSGWWWWWWFTCASQSNVHLERAFVV